MIADGETWRNPVFGVCTWSILIDLLLHMSTYKIRELPDTDDPRIIQCLVCVERMRRTLSGFIRHITQQLDRIPVTIPTRVTLAMIFRMAEASSSVELLCRKGYVRDAVVVLLTAFELKLDLSFISLKVSRAQEWIDHSHEGKKPWKVADQLLEIYQDHQDHEAEKEMYRTFCMVKHCNPAGKSSSFSMAVTRDSMLLDQSGCNNTLIPSYVFALGVYLQKAGEAASQIWTGQGLDVGDWSARLTDELAQLSSQNEQYMLELLAARHQQSTIKS